MLSLVPGSELPEMSFWELLTFDKVMHIFMYGVFSFKTMMAASKQNTIWWMRRWAGLFTIISVSLFGLSIEIMQETLLADRYGDWVDLLANTIGVFIGLYIFRAVFYDCIRR
jgi:VanZ family protein